MSRTAFLACLIALSGCSAGDRSAGAVGDPDRGAVVIERSACGSCHEIPGIPNADGRVGPPLSHFASRTVVAGVLPNTPQDLTRWILSPQSVVPGNAMPKVVSNEAQARDAAADLYTLH
jgi:cytochrome c2